MSDPLALFGRVIVALACVLALVWWFSRKAGAVQARRTGQGPTVRVVSRQSLSRHAGVAVIAVGQRRMLLGVSDQNITVLSELSAGADLDAAPTPAPQRTTTGEERIELDTTALNDTGHIVLTPTRPALAGSILAPATWRNAVTILRDKTIR